MKIKYLLAASAAALIVSGSAAKAADIVHYQEPEFKPASSFSWTGLYVGGTVGWGFGNAKTRLKNKATKATLYKKKMKPDGVKGGIYAGYNFEFMDGILLGVDTDFLASDESERKTKNGFRTSVRQRWNGATRLRAGYGFNRFLPYIAGGVSYADIKTGIGAQNISKSKSKTRAGWNVGAGIDYAMTDHIILRGEYRYTDLGKKSTNAGGIRNRTKYNESDVRLGIAYKF